MIILLIIFSLFHVQSWYNDNYIFRKKFWVSNPYPYDVYNVQTTVLMDTHMMIAAGQMRSDCFDVLFTDDLDNLVGFFLESGCGENATWWINITHLEPNQNREMFVYFKNPTESTFQGLTWGSNRFGFFSDLTCGGPLTHWDALNGKLLMGDSNEDTASFGTDTHVHVISGLFPICEADENAVLESYATDENEMSYESHTHTITLNDNTTQADALPLSRHLVGCRGKDLDSYYFGGLIPSGCYAAFEFSVPILGWDDVTDLNLEERYIRGCEDGLQGTNVGNSTHYHVMNFANSTIDACPSPTGVDRRRDNAGTDWDFAPAVHGHNNSFEPCTTLTANNEPMYKKFFFRKANGDQKFVNGMITFQYCGGTCADPPLGWERYEDLDGKLLRASSSDILGAGSGDGNHDHAYSCYTSVCSPVYKSNHAFHNEWTNLASHYHRYHGNVPNRTTLPSHVKLRFIKRKNEDNYTVTLKETEWRCFGFLSNDTSACSSNGSCTSPNYCSCVDGSTGKFCNESTGPPCPPNYFDPPSCNVTTCFGKLSNESSIVCSYGIGVCEAPEKCECQYLSPNDSSYFFINGSQCENLWIFSQPIISGQSANISQTIYTSYTSSQDSYITETTMYLEFCDDISIEFPNGINSPNLNSVWNETTGSVAILQEINSTSKFKQIFSAKKSGWTNISTEFRFYSHNNYISSRNIFFNNFFRFSDVLDTIRIDEEDVTKIYTFYHSPGYEVRAYPILTSKCNVENYAGHYFSSFTYSWTQVSGIPINSSSIPMNMSILELGKYNVFPFPYNESTNELSTVSLFIFEVEVSSSHGRFKKKNVEIVLQIRGLESFMSESSQTIPLNKNKTIMNFFRDPENSPFIHSIEWFCEFNGTSCEPQSLVEIQTETEHSILVFSPPNVGVFRVYCVYKKDGRNVTSFLDFEVIDFSAFDYFPEIHITSLPGPIDSSKKLGLEGQIKSFPDEPDMIQFSWSCPQLGPLLPGKNILTTTNSSLSLVVAPNIITAEFTTFYFSATYNDTLTVHSSIIIKRNFPPYGGDLVVLPKTGGEVQKTLFHFRFSNWIDTDYPLKYRLSFYDIIKEEYVLLTPNWFSQNDLKIVFPVQGCGGNDYSVNVLGEVRDYYGAVAYTNTSVQVNPANYATILEFVKYVNSKLIVRPMNKLIEKNGNNNLPGLKIDVEEYVNFILKTIHYTVKKDCVKIVAENSFCMTMGECLAVDIESSDPDVFYLFVESTIHFFLDFFRVVQHEEIPSLLSSDVFFQILESLEVTSDFNLANKTISMFDRYITTMMYRPSSSQVLGFVNLEHVNRLLSIPLRIIRSDYSELNGKCYDMIIEVLKFAQKSLSVTESLHGYFTDISGLTFERIFFVDLIKDFSSNFISSEKYRIRLKTLKLMRDRKETSNNFFEIEIEINEKIGMEYLWPENDVLSFLAFNRLLSSSEEDYAVEIHYFFNNEHMDPVPAFLFSLINQITFRNLKIPARRSSADFQFVCFYKPSSTQAETKCKSTENIGLDQVKCDCENGYFNGIVFLKLEPIVILSPTTTESESDVDDSILAAVLASLSGSFLLISLLLVAVCCCCCLGLIFGFVIVIIVAIVGSLGSLVFFLSSIICRFWIERKNGSEDASSAARYLGSRSNVLRSNEVKRDKRLEMQNARLQGFFKKKRYENYSDSTRSSIGSLDSYTSAPRTFTDSSMSGSDHGSDMSRADSDEVGSAVVTRERIESIDSENDYSFLQKETVTTSKNETLLDVINTGDDLGTPESFSEVYEDSSISQSKEPSSLLSATSPPSTTPSTLEVVTMETNPTFVKVRKTLNENLAVRQRKESTRSEHTLVFEAEGVYEVPSFGELNGGRSQFGLGHQNYQKGVRKEKRKEWKKRLTIMKKVVKGSDMSLT